MNFTASEDVEVPIDVLFEHVSDFEAFERSALRRGADVTRTDSLPQPGVGMEWDVAFMMRGKRRQLSARMQEYDPPNGMLFLSSSNGIGGTFRVDLVALSRNRTRLKIAIELAPSSLSARLLVQSLKLARSKLNKRFSKRLASFAKDAEDSYRRMA